MNHELHSLSVVLPAYNDEKNISKVVQDALNVLNKLSIVDFEIIIVEDGSPDNTGKITDELAALYPNIRVIHHQKNWGYGATLKDGFLHATKDYIFYTDGDAQFDMSDLAKCIALLKQADIVVGYRRVKQYSLYRRMLSWLYNMILRELFHLPFRDINCAFKIFPAKLFRDISISSTGAFIDAEILLKARNLNYRLAEIDVTHLPRLYGASTGARIPALIITVQEVARYILNIKTPIDRQ